jgi:hypothetical protein
MRLGVGVGHRFLVNVGIPDTEASGIRVILNAAAMAVR